MVLSRPGAAVRSGCARRRSALVWGVFLVLVLLHQVAIHFGYLHWAIDVWAHMQLQLLVLGTLVFVLLALLAANRWFTCVGLLYMLGFGVWVLVPLRVEELRTTAIPVDVYFQNVLVGQAPTAHSLMAKTIATYPADIVAVVEPHPAFVDTLARELGSDPVLVRTRSGLGCAVFVRDGAHVVQEAHIYTAPDHDPICVVSFEAFDLFVVHPLPPLDAYRFARQATYFAALEAMIQERVAASKPWVVVGDFNATRYSSSFRRYFGAYVWEQYHTWAWPHILSVPIDQAFGSAVADVEIYPALTSDHRGLGVQLAL